MVAVPWLWYLRGRMGVAARTCGPVVDSRWVMGSGEVTRRGQGGGSEGGDRDKGGDGGGGEAAVSTSWYMPVLLCTTWQTHNMENA